MAKPKKWTKKDYQTQAEEFVSCYGTGYCWDEFMYEYCQLFEGTLPFNVDKLMNAIYEAEKAALAAEPAKKKSKKRS